jgi:uncharacterized protein (DUF2164 family)
VFTLKTKVSLEKDIKKNLVEEIKRFFWNERNEELNDLAAEILLDFVLNTIGPHIYNEGIKDAYAFMNEKVEDLFGLEKR